MILACSSSVSTFAGRVFGPRRRSSALGASASGRCVHRDRAPRRRAPVTPSFTADAIEQQLNFLKHEPFRRAPCPRCRIRLPSGERRREAVGCATHRPPRSATPRAVRDEYRTTAASLRALGRRDRSSSPADASTPSIPVTRDSSTRHQARPRGVPRGGRGEAATTLTPKKKGRTARTSATPRHACHATPLPWPRAPHEAMHASRRAPTVSPARPAMSGDVSPSRRASRPSRPSPSSCTGRAAGCPGR